MRAMGKMKSGLAAVLILGLFGASAYVSVRVFLAFQNGHRISEMDWNGDGRTSLLEVVYGSDVIRRKINVGSDECVEFRSMKDASTIKTVCP